MAVVVARGPWPLDGSGLAMGTRIAKARAASEQVCHYCFQPATTMDHIVPRSLGGTSARVNLIPACQPCNLAKGATMPDVDHRPGGCPICKQAVERWLLLRQFTRRSTPKVKVTAARADIAGREKHTIDWGTPNPMADKGMSVIP